MRRVVFLIDGFNLYHSIEEIRVRTGHSLKWLDIHRFCLSCLPIIGKDAVLGQVYYFSALRSYAIRNNPGTVTRHRDYIACIADTGVNVILGRFKKKDVFCPNCRSTNTKHEEKETDVAMAVQIMDICIQNQADAIIVITGDTDLAPAIRKVRERFPAINITFAFPFQRKNLELAAITTIPSFDLKVERYKRCQFQDPYTLKSGRVVSKPSGW